MNPTQIKDFICDFFNLLNEREFDKLKNVLSPQVVFYFPGTSPLHGPKKVAQLMRIIYRRYADLTFKIEDVIVQENRIATIWRNSGSDTKGNLYNNEGVTIFKIDHGVIIYLSDYFKDTSFL